MITTKNKFFTKYYFGKKYSVLAPRKGVRRKDIRYFPQRITRIQVNKLLIEAFKKSFYNLDVKFYNIKILRLTPTKITIFYRSYYTEINLFVYKNRQLNSNFQNIEELIEKSVFTMNKFIIEIDERIKNW